MLLSVDYDLDRPPRRVKKADHEPLSDDNYISTLKLKQLSFLVEVPCGKKSISSSSSYIYFFQFRKWIQPSFLSLFLSFLLFLQSIWLRNEILLMSILLTDTDTHTVAPRNGLNVILTNSNLNRNWCRGKKGLTIHFQSTSWFPIHTQNTQRKKKEIDQSRKINDKRVLIQCIERRNRLCLSFLFLLFRFED